jgi:prevent-host-death family protein
LAFESALRGRVEPEEFTASQAKNEFAHALESAITKGAVVITKHASPKAVLLSVEEFKELTRDRTEKLASFHAHYDAMFERMQQPDFDKGLDALFSATSEDFARAAMTKPATMKKRKNRG